MKFYTMDKTVLMDVSKVSTHKDGIVIEGKIMGTMPMKAVLRPEELRAGMRFVSLTLIWLGLKMLVTGKT
jgi:hypothetical protein